MEHINPYVWIICHATMCAAFSIALISTNFQYPSSIMDIIYQQATYNQYTLCFFPANKHLAEAYVDSHNLLYINYCQDPAHQFSYKNTTEFYYSTKSSHNDMLFTLFYQISFALCTILLATTTGDSMFTYSQRLWTNTKMLIR